MDRHQQLNGGIVKGCDFSLALLVHDDVQPAKARLLLVEVALVDRLDSFDNETLQARTGGDLAKHRGNIPPAGTADESLRSCAIEVLDRAAPPRFPHQFHALVFFEDLDVVDDVAERKPQSVCDLTRAEGLRGQNIQHLDSRWVPERPH